MFISYIVKSNVYPVSGILNLVQVGSDVDVSQEYTALPLQTHWRGREQCLF